MSQDRYAVQAICQDGLPVQVTTDTLPLAEELAELMDARGYTEVKIADRVSTDETPA